MKRVITLLLSLSLLMICAACGSGSSDKGSTSDGSTETTDNQGDTGTADEKENANPAPSGLYMLKYIGNESGDYVDEYNVYEDFFGEPVKLLEMIMADNTTIWCEIGDDGTGTFTSGSNDPVSMDFNTGDPGMLLLGERRYPDGYTEEEKLVPYHYDDKTGVFWFEETSGYWTVMDPCSQEKLDLIFEGKGGSVPLAEANIGDLVCLGSYDTDDNSDDIESIYWRVLDKDGDRLLILSDKLLDSFSYNYNPDREILTDVTWENCSLRAFLNDTEEGFLTMFTEDEQTLIQVTHLKNEAANDDLMAQWGGLEDQGEKTYSDLAIQDRPDDPDTDDKVFLLSYQEVLSYFGEPTEEPEQSEDANDYPFTVLKVNPDWIAYVTDAVKGGYYDNETRGGAWLTRTLCNSHSDEDMAVYIASTGQVFDYFTYVPLFIRPAMWVKTGE